MKIPWKIVHLMQRRSHFKRSVWHCHGECISWHNRLIANKILGLVVVKYWSPTMEWYRWGFLVGKSPMSAVECLRMSGVVTSLQLVMHAREMRSVAYCDWDKNKLIKLAEFLLQGSSVMVQRLRSWKRSWKELINCLMNLTLFPVIMMSSI